MKLDLITKTAIAAGLLAADKGPAFEAAVLAADASMPGNVASSKEIEDKAQDKRAKDRAARDAKRKAARDAADKKVAEDRAAKDKARDEKRAAKDAARDAARGANDKTWAKDRSDDPEGTNDKVMAACDAAMKSEGEAEDTAEAKDEDYSTSGDPTTPGGNRAHGQTAVDTAAEVAKALAARDDLHAARTEVEPILGKVTMDSAAEVRRAGLKKLGVDAAAVHESALAGMLQMAKDKAAAAVVPAADAATGSVAAMEKLIPGYGRLK